MKYLLAFFILTASASARVINTNDMIPRTAYPAKIGGTHNLTIEELRYAGWRDYVPCQSVNGSNIVSTSYSDDGDTVTASCEYEATVEPIPQPAPFPEGIETPVLVLQDLTQTNVAYGFYADDGELIGGILDHASPRDPVAIQDRITSNRLFRSVLRQDAKTVRTNMTALIDLSSTNIAAIKLINVGTNANAAAVRSALILSIVQLEETAKIQKQQGQEIKSLAGIVRQLLKDSKD